jgi:hypothetical protein
MKLSGLADLVGEQFSAMQAARDAGFAKIIDDLAKDGGGWSLACAKTGEVSSITGDITCGDWCPQIEITTWGDCNELTSPTDFCVGRLKIFFPLQIFPPRSRKLFARADVPQRIASCACNRVPPRYKKQSFPLPIAFERHVPRAPR